MPIVAFATHQQIPDITDDDRLAADVLRARGIDVVAAVWDAPGADWSRFDATVIRSTWDYHLKPDRYASWLRQFDSTRGSLWNPSRAVLANLNKRYLLDLAERGVRVVPTVYQPAGGELSLRDVLVEHGWRDAVVKPAVSASGWKTWRTSLAAAERDQAGFVRQLREQDLLIQPYLAEVASEGEWSLVFIDRRFSHAALKKPRPGEFRVQRHLGGTTVRGQPDSRLIEAAESALACVEHPLLYARVDGIERGGRFVVMEVEINEPFLFLGYSDAAGGRLADAIACRL